MIKPKEKQEQKEKEITKEKEIDLSKLKFEFDLSKANYQIDILQNRLLEGYLRVDMRFRRAFSTNYTLDFLQFIKDKSKLHEPIHLSVIGQVRCQAKGSKVLMSNGEWKNIEDIKIGDEVISPQKNGKNVFSKVTGISQSISDENYDFFEQNGKSYWLFNCSKEHIIPTHVYKLAGSGTKKIHIGDGIAENSAKRLFEMKHQNHRIITSYPITKFKNRKNCKINPYFLGLYLGDGHYTQSIGFTNSDKKILKMANEIYKPMNEIHKKGSPNCVTNLYSKSSKLAILLRKYGLKNKKSVDKFIPKEALLSDINYRRKLLSGLIDTDGFLSRSTAYSITTKSFQMAQDILFVVQSLGGNGHILKKQKGIKKLNFLGNYFHVSFYLGKKIEHLKLNKTNKKRDSTKSYWKNSANRLSFKIKKKKECLVYGIELDSLSKYYITDNMVVVHNSGKSYTAITICAFHQACYGKKFSTKYICANAFEFLEKIKTMPQEELTGRIFLIDEEKQTIFGTGSLAKKIKLQDVANIIAVHDISTISLNPVSWANKDSFYGIRLFGRDFFTKTTRGMLYNLQEKGHGGELPLGCLYLPIFTAFLPKDYADELEKAYLKKKMEWVNQEQRGETDVLYDIKKKSAESFMRDKQYLELKTKPEKLAYIGLKLGSEWTTGEKEEIFYITKLIEKEINLE